jgi:DNA-binding winged helix-turn-helix (wHTH) protein
VSESFQVGELLVDPQQQIIYRNCDPLVMTELSIKLFMILLQSAPACIGKDELINQV